MWPRQLHACVAGCKSVSALWGFELVCVICTIRISAHLGKNVCNSLHLNLLMMRESVFHPQLDSSTSSKNIWYKKQQPLTRTQVHQMFNIYNFPKTPLRMKTFWVQEMETSRNLSGISFDRFQHMISDLSLDQAKGRVMGWQWGGCQPLWKGCLWLLGWLTIRPGLNSGGWCHSEDQFHSVQNTIERPCCSREG